MRSFSGAINDYLCGRSKTLKQGDYGKQESASGKSAEELLHSDDKTLSQVMVRDSGHRNTDSEKLDELTPLLEDYARQMQLRNMTYQLLFGNYSQRVQHPYGYTQFKEKLQAYEKAHSYSFHNVYEPAGEMQVDYAGDKLWIMDPRTRVGQEAYVLVCVLPFSSLAFVTAMLSTTMSGDRRHTCRQSLVGAVCPLPAGVPRVFFIFLDFKV